VSVVVALPDMHLGSGAPWHERRYLTCALACVEKLSPDMVLLHGDLCDMAALSGHGRTPSERIESLETEYQEAGQVLDHLSETCERLVMLEGNHEYRLRRCAANDLRLRSAQGLLDPQRVLPAGRSMKYVPYGRGRTSAYRVAPGLMAVHGWSHAKSAAPVHLAHAGEGSITYGHTHRCEAVTVMGPSGPRHAWSAGCLSPLQPPYRTAAPTAWTHGFSLIFVGRRSFTHYIINIHDGTAILPDGQRVTGES